MLIGAKSNLARLMATENLIIEERNVPTAGFDIKSRVLIIPTLNGNLTPELYDLLFGHEVGHALETPAEGWHNSVIDHKVNKSILNVCEDVRIEKKIKRRFPGLKPSFVRGYQQLLDMDFFGVKDQNINALNFIDRVNLYTKGGSTQGIEFSQEEQVLLQEVESTETWDEVVTVARKIQTFMCEELEKMEQEQELKLKIKIKIGNGEGEETEELTEEELNQLEEILHSENIDIEIIESSDEEGGSKEDSAEKKEVGNSGATKTKSDILEKLKAFTDEKFREKEKTLYEKNSRDTIYTNIPKVNLKNVVVPHKEILAEFAKQFERNEEEKNYHVLVKKNFIKFKNESSKVVSYLVKEFELRKNAEQQSRAKVSKTGDLNMSRVHEYKLTDDIFARMTKVPNGKSHGLVMYIDWSGSMQDKIHATIKQLLNLVLFCKKVNIPFDVYAFTSQWIDESEIYDQKIQTKQVGDLDIGNFTHLLNLFNNRMSSRDIADMASYLLGVNQGYLPEINEYKKIFVPKKLRLGGTPLNHTIVCAFEMIPEFKEKNKLDVVNAVFLTDGESSLIGSRISYIDTHTNRHATTSEARPTNRLRVIFRDPVTKATQEVRYGYWLSNAAQETIALLKLLKQRANCNLLGFYVASTRDMRTAYDLYSPEVVNCDNHFTKRDILDRLMAEFRKTKTGIIRNVGYDEYYLISVNNLDTDDDELTVNSTTTRGLVSAFSKYTGGKVNSRVILNRFIGMIA